MKHCIIVKFKETVEDKLSLIAEVKTLFSKYTEYSFLSGCEMKVNCIDRDNRFDLMIILNLEKSSLQDWDACSLHKEWKSRFGDCVDKKAIFDYE